MPGFLLPTKLDQPRLRGEFLPRPHLLARLNAGLGTGESFEHKLTVVCAPAGYGKTALTSEWLGSCGKPVAGLTLDETDNEPRRFLIYLIAALQEVDVKIGEAVMAMLHVPEPPSIQFLLTALTNELAVYPRPFILVLDNYHLIHSQEVHDQLAFMVLYLVPNMHLVIVTQAEPPVPLARLRARNQLTELTQADLSFTQDECSALLRQVMHLRPTKAQVQALLQHTGGSVAGLLAAAHLLKDRRERDTLLQELAGSPANPIDYLFCRLFERQPDEAQEFMLSTCILESFTAELCAAVTGQTAVQERLHNLAELDLLVVYDGQDQRWYRYHPLLAELLQQRLRLDQQLDVAGLHRRASDWYAAHDFLPEAVKHALAARDWERAAGLLRANARGMIASGEQSAFLNWLRALPDELVSQDADLCRDCGWALTLSRQVNAGRLYLKRAELASANDPERMGEVLVAQAYNLRAAGDVQGTIEAAERARPLLSPENAMTRGLMEQVLGMAYLQLGQIRQAETTIQAVDQIAEQSGIRFSRPTFQAALGHIYAIAGQLQRAEEYCKQVTGVRGESAPIANAHILQGAIQLERNDLEGAAAQLKAGIQYAQRSDNAAALIDGYRMLALLQQANAALKDAHATLKKADEAISKHDVPPFVRMAVIAGHVRLALAQGDLAAASVWAATLTLPADVSLLYPHLALTPVRLLLAQDDKAAAAARLAGLHEKATQLGWLSGALEVRALQALTAPTQAEALEFLKDALHKGQAEGFVRTFIDKGQPMRRLLEQLASKPSDLGDYLSTLLNAF